MNFSPMDFARAILVICVGLAILVPVLGVTARIALKPIADAFARMREGQNSGDSMLLLERRMDLLEREMQSIAAIRDDVARLEEAQEFQLRLADGTSATRPEKQAPS
jgi:hypothetical protein